MWSFARIVLPLAVLALGAFALFAVIDRMGASDRAAERRVIHERAAALSRAALAPGTALACVTGVVGETVENACEKQVFASPERAAAAVAFMGAQLQLLKDATAARPDASLLADLAAIRRAVELDRFGLAAQVLAVRDGCTAERCAAFALVEDADALKSNLKAQVFEQYVARHAAAWSAPVAADKPPAAAVSEAPPAGDHAALAAAPPPEPVARPLSGKYDFPSAASIPPVSIMNTEPPRPKEDAAAVQGAPPPQRPQAEAAPPAPAR